MTGRWPHSAEGAHPARDLEAVDSGMTRSTSSSVDAVIPEPFEALFAVGCLHHLETKRLQHVRQQDPVLRTVVGDQDRPAFLPRYPVGASSKPLSAGSHPGTAARGRATLKVLPRPGRLSTSSSPPISSTSSLVIARPSPVPSTTAPRPVSCSNGWKIFSRALSGIPAPYPRC